MLVVMFGWRFARLIAAAVTTTIIISSNKIQNGDILAPANPGPPGKWTLKTEREREKGKNGLMERHYAAILYPA